MKLNFRELITEISEESHESKNHVQQFMTEFKSVIIEGLKRDGLVRIRGLGAFKLKWVESRTGRNPLTGEPIEIEAHNKVVFKPQKELKESVNSKYAHLLPEILEDEINDVEASEVIAEGVSLAEDIVKEEIVEEIEIEEPLEEVVIAEEKIEYPKEEEIKEKSAFTNYQASTMYDSINNDKKEKTKKLFKRVIVGVLILLGIWFLIPNEKSEVAVSEKIEPVNEVIVEKPLQKEKPVKIEEQKFDNYKIKSKDTLWNIAKEKYGNAYLWPMIYAANAKKLDNPDVIFAGDDLVIPKLEVGSNALTQYELTQLAEGNLLEYFVLKNKGSSQAKYFLWVSQQRNPEVVENNRQKIDPDDLIAIKKMKKLSNSKQQKKDSLLSKKITRSTSKVI